MPDVQKVNPSGSQPGWRKVRDQHELDLNTAFHKKSDGFYYLCWKQMKPRLKLFSIYKLNKAFLRKLDRWNALKCCIFWQPAYSWMVQHCEKLKHRKDIKNVNLPNQLTFLGYAQFLSSLCYIQNTFSNWSRAVDCETHLMLEACIFYPLWKGGKTNKQGRINVPLFNRSWNKIPLCLSGVF